MPPEETDRPDQSASQLPPLSDIPHFIQEMDEAIQQIREAGMLTRYQVEYSRVIPFSLDTTQDVGPYHVPGWDTIYYANNVGPYLAIVYLQQFDPKELAQVLINTIQTGSLIQPRFIQIWCDEHQLPHVRELLIKGTGLQLVEAEPSEIDVLNPGLTVSIAGCANVPIKSEQVHIGTALRFQVPSE